MAATADIEEMGLGVGIGTSFRMQGTANYVEWDFEAGGGEDRRLVRRHGKGERVLVEKKERGEQKKEFEIGMPHVVDGDGVVGVVDEVGNGSEEDSDLIIDGQGRRLFK